MLATLLHCCIATVKPKRQCATVKIWLQMMPAVWKLRCQQAEETLQQTAWRARISIDHLVRLGKQTFMIARCLACICNEKRIAHLARCASIRSLRSGMQMYRQQETSHLQGCRSPSFSCELLTAGTCHWMMPALWHKATSGLCSCWKSSQSLAGGAISLHVPSQGDAKLKIPAQALLHKPGHEHAPENREYTNTCINSCSLVMVVERAAYCFCSSKCTQPGTDQRPHTISVCSHSL